MAARSSILGNAGDRGAWRATVHRVAKSWTGLSTHTHTHTHENKACMLSVVNHMEVCSAFTLNFTSCNLVFGDSINSQMNLQTKEGRECQ